MKGNGVLLEPLSKRKPTQARADNKDAWGKLCDGWRHCGRRDCDEEKEREVYSMIEDLGVPKETFNIGVIVRDLMCTIVPARALSFSSSKSTN